MRRYRIRAYYDDLGGYVEVAIHAPDPADAAEIAKIVHPYANRFDEPTPISANADIP